MAQGVKSRPRARAGASIKNRAHLAGRRPGGVICRAVEQVYIGLGSNVGDRERALERALAALAAGDLTLTRRSSLYLTEPVQAPPPEWFLNAAAASR